MSLATPETQDPVSVVSPSPLQQKRENLHRLLDLFARQSNEDEPVPNDPLLLHLEITSRCNLRCLKCGHATDPPGSARIAPRHLPYAIVETFDEFFASAVCVHTFGYGEMFLYAKLRRLVERLKHFDCIVDGITNGVLVGEQEVNWLVEYGYDELTFSIDGVTAETMRRLRGVDVEKLWTSLAYLKRRKRETGSDKPRVVVNFVAQSDNYHELPDLVRKLAEFDVFFFGVNPLMPADPNGNPEDAYNKLYREFGLPNVPRPRLEAAIEEARALAQKAGIGFCAYIDLDALYADRYCTPATKLLQILPQQNLERIQSEARLQPYYCTYPWTSVYVHADTGARVCCYMDGSLGNVHSGEDLRRVWTEGPITEIRSAIRQGEVHPSCMSCVQLGRYQHSYTHLEDMQRHLGEPASAPEPAVEAPAVKSRGAIRRAVDAARRLWTSPARPGDDLT